MRVECTLMHKNIAVADLELDEVTSAIIKVDTVYAYAHMPLGCLTRQGTPNRSALNEWWIDRSIPASRSGVRKALETLHLPNTQALLTRCFGLSLSDQYWIRPEGQPLEWSQINFFEHPFSEDIGDVLLGKADKHGAFDFQSPDNTSDGCLKKRWKLIDGKRCLLKAGSRPFLQQPFNEVIASYIAQQLDIPHVDYTLLWDEGEPYSVCEDFITADTELISAWRVMQTQKRGNSTSVYQHYLNCCETLGVQGVIHAVDQMIVLDYLIANEDRHQNNFGLIRNAETLEWMSPAPIFDSGSSLGYDKLTGQIRTGRGIECKPFKKTYEEQLKLVTDLSWIDFSKLDGLGEVIMECFAPAEDFIDESRVKAIISSVNSRIAHLHTLAQTQRQTVDDQREDVAEDIAADYLPHM